jgi:hypothetical protein
MSKQVEITIPRFKEEVQLSVARRKKYFRVKDKLPEKYKGSNFEFRKHGRENHLYDTEKKEFVVMNPVAAGTPNIMRISGNEIYARMHERKRMAIVKAIKNDMRPCFPKKLGLELPIMIDIELYTTPKYCNWDLDNLWIYNKCFQDLLVDEKLIPEDNILNITKAGAPRYIPVVHERDRRMIFTLSEDHDPRIKTHVMYNLGEKKEFSYLNKGDENIIPDSFYEIKRGTIGKVGDLVIDSQSRTFFIQIGKLKITYGGLSKALGRVYSQCIQLNCRPYVSKKFFEEHESWLRKELLDKGVHVLILK